MRNIVESSDGNGMREREGGVGELKLFGPSAHRAIRDASLIVLNPKQETSGLNVVYPLLTGLLPAHIPKKPTYVSGMPMGCWDCVGSMFCPSFFL